MPNYESFDLTLITPTRREGFMTLPRSRNPYSSGLGQDRDITGSFGPAELQHEIAKSRDLPVIWDDLQGGCGMSQKIADYPGYSYGKNVCTRIPKVLLPGPNLFPVKLAGATDIQVTTIASWASPTIKAIDWEGETLFTAGENIYKILGASPLVTSTKVAALTGANLCDIVMYKTAISSISNTVYRGIYISDRNGNLIRKLEGVGAGIGFWDRAPVPSPPTNPAITTPVRFTKMAHVYQAKGDRSGYQIYAVDGGSVYGDSVAWHCIGDPFVPANWNGPLYIGKGYSIRNLAASNRHVYFVCEDGVYDVDENGYSPNLTAYWADFPSTSNGQYATVYNGKVLASHALGMDQVPVGQSFRVDFPNFCHPGVGLPNDTPVYGPVTAGINEGGWQVIAQYNGKDAYISYGKERHVLGIDGPGPFVWHNEIYIPGEKVIGFHLSNLSGQNLMYIFTQVGGNGRIIRIYAATVPNASTALQDWLDSGKHRFNPSFSLYLPADEWGDGAARKHLMRFDLQADDLGQVNAVNVSVSIYARSELNDWQYQGTTNISPRSTVYPVNGFLEGYKLQVRIDGVGYTDTTQLGGQTYPPIVRTLKARAGVSTEQRETRTFRLRISNGELRNGAYDRRDPNELEDWLYSLQNFGPITAVDNKGKTKTVKVESGTTYIETADPATSDVETVVELTVSVIEQQAQPPALIIPPYTGPRWGDGGPNAPAVGADLAWQTGGPNAGADADPNKNWQPD